MGKLIAQNEIDNLKKELRGETLVSTNGCFDILHVGHVRYLKAARSLGNKLIVCLNSDKSVKSIKGETRPINCEADRAEILCSLNCVDYVIIFDEDSPRNLLAKIKPNIHTKGADWSMKTLPEADVILECGGRIEFIDFVPNRSTTLIIEKMNK